MEKKITERFIIDDVEKALYGFSKANPVVCADARIEDLIPNDPNVYYFDNQFKHTDDEHAPNALMESEVTSRDGKHKVYVGLRRYDNWYSEEYCGHMVGTASHLAYRFGLSERAVNNLVAFEKKLIRASEEEQAVLIKGTGTLDVLREHNTTKEAVLEDDDVKKAAEEIVNDVDEEENVADFIKVLYKESTYINSQFRTLKGFARHIDRCAVKGKEYVDKNMSEFYIKSPCGDIALNTGLFNAFGRPIIILFKWNCRHGKYFSIGTLDPETATDWSENRMVYRKIKAVDFVGAERLSVSRREDFYLKNGSLSHICDQNRDRFPESFSELGLTKLSRAVENELSLAASIMAVNPGYAKPIYRTYKAPDGIVRGSLSWYLPLHVDTEFDQEPELVMAVSKIDGRYEVLTIIPWNNDMVHDRTVSTSLYQAW